MEESHRHASSDSDGNNSKSGEGNEKADQPERLANNELIPFFFPPKSF